MIIYIIQIERIAVLETEDQSPVSRHGEAPNIFPIALQFVQSPTWKQPDFIDGVCLIDHGKHVFNLRHYMDGKVFSNPFLIESAQSSVSHLILADREVSVSPSSLDTYSDRYFKWHVDSASNVLVLDGNSGRLQLSGPLKLPVYTTLPASGSVGDVIYYDDQEDDRLDGMYFWNALAWAKTMTE